MKIICISGHAQNGKDTVAGMIKEELEARGRKVLITHYADLLKYVCREFFDWDGKKDEHGRQLLQMIGTNVVRAKCPDFWVLSLASIVSVLCEDTELWDYAVIPDARFPNEIDRWRDFSFEVEHLRVVRPGFQSELTAEQKNHPSETALDDVEPDSTIENSGSLQDLREQVNKWIGGRL